MKHSLHQIRGAIDAQTRCAHYNGDRDIVAIKFKCCGVYYPCYKCHEEASDHGIVRWSKLELNERAILCGQCHNELTINEYLNANSQCVHCKAHFNPQCANHWDIYFEIDEIQ